jgi:membrane-associated phospholipid phosphatase
MSVVVKAKYVILLIILNFLAYSLIQYLITINEYNFLTDLDIAIPFIPEFIWVYHTLIPIIGISAIVLIKNRKLFFSTLNGYIIATIILSIFYIFLPSFYPRQLITDSSVSSYMVELTRLIDNANNTFPSGHVTFSWLLALFLMKSDCAKKWKWLGPTYLIWAILISISTLVLKQHYIVDVISGIILATACFYLASTMAFKQKLYAN